MYSRLPSFVLGFHGCDKVTHDYILKEGGSLNLSNNPYDWLGNGVYFWEQNPQRALDFAIEIKNNPRRGRARIDTPSVIGAIIDLQNCLNLFDSKYIDLVDSAYKVYCEITPKEERAENRGGNDLLLRYLDCAVIQTVHQHIRDLNEHPFDSVRGLSREGDPLYQDSGFYKKSHIQICVCNLLCIKGYFDPKIDVV
jgi:hypothetical protein